MDELLKQILSVQSYSGSVERMNEFILACAESLGGSVRVDKNNIYVVKGEPLSAGYPCVVAHTDTVHKIIPDNEYTLIYDPTHNIAYAYNPVKRNFTGVGGDDKVGIYIALKCLERFDSIKLAFFRDEEIGCKGSADADLNFFKDCMYILQCDRRGNGDFITDINGPISSQEFQQDIIDIVSSYGYKYANGMTTDVGKLVSLDVGVSCANMSCGYYNPHCDNEIIDINDMNNTMEMVFEIVGTVDKRYEFIRPKKRQSSFGYSSGYYGGYAGRNSWQDDGWGGVYKETDLFSDKGYKTNSYVGKTTPAAKQFIDLTTDCPTVAALLKVNWFDLYVHCIAVRSGVTYFQNSNLYRVANVNGGYNWVRLDDIVADIEDMEKSLNTVEQAQCWVAFDLFADKADAVRKKWNISSIKSTLPIEAKNNISVSYQLIKNNLTPGRLRKAKKKLKKTNTVAVEDKEDLRCACGNEITRFQKEYNDAMCQQCFNATVGIL